VVQIYFSVVHHNFWVVQIQFLVVQQKFTPVPIESSQMQKDSPPLRPPFPSVYRKYLPVPPDIVGPLLTRPEFSEGEMRHLLLTFHIISSNIFSHEKRKKVKAVFIMRRNRLAYSRIILKY
jgi:hypothetical protein